MEPSWFRSVSPNHSASWFKRISLRDSFPSWSLSYLARIWENSGISMRFGRSPSVSQPVTKMRSRSITGTDLSCHGMPRTHHNFLPVSRAYEATSKEPGTISSAGPIFGVDRGRGVTARIFRPHRLPEHPSGRGIDRNQVRPGVLIADERQLSIGEDWRGAVAVWIVERTQRQTPTLVAIRSVGQQSEVAKEHVNIGSICDWRWRGGSVCRLETLHAFARRLPPP